MMYQQKRQYSIQAVLLVFALILSLLMLALSLIFAPFSLATLDMATQTVLAYWYLSISAAHRKASTPYLAALLVVVFSLEGYMTFGATMLLEVGVGVMAILMIGDFHNWKSGAKYGLIACLDILSGNAEVD
jgi:hypothetical protein